ncbi:MAG: retroviral-like aspartic protease family protein [Gammaproteobacteria bacterium]|nr:retroviral-like aspartic protease family protein [Gammaproteobacteria bacterium]
MKIFLLIISLTLSNGLYASQFDTSIPMDQKHTQAFYINANIAGSGATELMVDTGSGYLVLNETTLHSLKRKGHAAYLRQLQGIMADGTQKTVDVYQISSIKIGETCVLRNVEAAIFPGNTRQILGLSALQKAAPFIFSIEPPELVLSGCNNTPAQS